MIGILKAIFGGTTVKDVAEVFAVNKEAQAARLVGLDAATVAQYAAEFHERANRTWIDALADGINRLIRPLVTLMILAPLPLTIYNPAEAASTWEALATLPDAYWALLGVVMAFYFGGRMQIKSQDFQKSFAKAASAARTLQPSERKTEEPNRPDVPAEPPIDSTRDFIAELRAMS